LCFVERSARRAIRWDTMGYIAGDPWIARTEARRGIIADIIAIIA
jgi:hypothetical protein